MDVIRVGRGVWLVVARIDAVPADPVRPAEEREAAGLTGPRAEQFLAARRLLRRLLSRVRPGTTAPDVVRGEHGRPELAGEPRLGVSISHDADVVAAGVADRREIGVDVQVPPDRVGDGLVRRCLGEHADRLSGWPGRRRAEELSWVWTAQEACVKAEGTGLSGRPWAIEVPPGRIAGRWKDYRWVSLRGRSPVPLSCAFGTSPATGTG